MSFKSHKIRGIDKSVCNKEQVFAYNYLWHWTFNDHDKGYALSCIQQELAAKANGTYGELYTPIHPWKPGGCDYDLVYHYVLQSWDRYAANKQIFSDYAELAKVIYSDDFQEATK